MKKKLDIGAVLALLVCVAAITFVITRALITEDYNAELQESYRINLELTKFLEAKSYIEKSYVGSWDDEALLDGATKGMVDSLGDRWSTYLSAEDFTRYNNPDKDVYAGIGVMSVYDEETGGIQITEVYSDSPAESAGLQPMDIIISVDGTEVAVLDYLVALEMVKGTVNTPITLEVYRPSKRTTTTYNMFRASVQANAIKSQILDNDVGLIRIRNFDTGTDIAFVDAVERLKAAGVRGIIFDVRSNPGGRVNVMLPMLDLLLPEGNLITMREKSGKEEVFVSKAEALGLPMVVVINEHSYSAAEFFAAALQEYEKAILVGQPTFGKGYAQVDIPLSDGSGLILSTNEYFTPKGNSLADVGLTPDYLVSVTPEQAANINTLAPKDDPQIAKAIEVISWSLTPVA